MHLPKFGIRGPLDTDKRLLGKERCRLMKKERANERTRKERLREKRKNKQERDAASAAGEGVKGGPKKEQEKKKKRNNSDTMRLRNWTNARCG